MTDRQTRMVALGYGRFVRADQIVALIPVEGESRGEGQRTYVHLEGVEEPVVASRSPRWGQAMRCSALGTSSARALARTPEG